MCDIIKEIIDNNKQIVTNTAALQKINLGTILGRPKDYLRKIIVTAQNCFTAITAFNIICYRFPTTNVVLFYAVLS